MAMNAMGAGGPGGLGFLVAVSERGHDDPQAGMLPTIPLAREVGGHLAAPAESGPDLRAMPPAGRDWLLGAE